MYETELYCPVKELFEEMGYEVSAEVADCDIIAEREGERIVIELKTSFNLKLIYQLVERQTVCRDVYAAIPKPKSLRGKRWGETLRLLRRLEAGLVLIKDIDKKPYAEIVLEAGHNKSHLNYKKRKRVTTELEKRETNLNTGGSTKQKLITAYRENALLIACCLFLKGDMKCTELRRFGTGDKTYSILRNNFYGWFDRSEDKVYSLTDDGRDAISDYKSICETYIERLNRTDKENPS